MIRLVFTANREMVHFLIINKSIYYSDRKWATWIRCLPRPENFIQKIKDNKDKSPLFLINLFNYTKEELEQYSSAKDESSIADLIIADARTKGCRLLLRKEGDIKDEELKKQILESELVSDISQKTEVTKNSIT